MAKVHNSTEFFIDGKMILIRPMSADEELASSTFSQFVDKFVTYGEFDTAPDLPLKHFCGSKSDQNMVFVAELQEAAADSPIGIGLYKQNPDTLAHEYSVLVDAHYTSSRLPFELTSALAQDAAESGVKTLCTSDSSEHLQLARIARELKMSSRLNRFRRVKYSLQVDKQPWLVELG